MNCPICSKQLKSEDGYFITNYYCLNHISFQIRNIHNIPTCIYYWFSFEGFELDGDYQLWTRVRQLKQLSIDKITKKFPPYILILKTDWISVNNPTEELPQLLSRLLKLQAFS